MDIGESNLIECGKTLESLKIVFRKNIDLCHKGKENQNIIMFEEQMNQENGGT